MTNVIFIAPPAAGKGTYSKQLINLGYNHISTGQLLREEIANETELGLKVKDLINGGNLASDEIVIELIKNKLNDNDKPFILDGFPRTINQAKYLTNLLKELNNTNYEVILLDVTLEEAMKRALGRRECECGKSYNLHFPEFSPKDGNNCDDCGRELIKRNDDNEKSFKVRFETFKNNSKPIVDYYKDLGKLHVLDVTNKNVIDDIKKILNIELG